jgi:signal transduction histidine kinase
MGDDTRLMQAMRAQLETLARGGLSETVEVPAGTDAGIAGLCETVNNLVAVFRESQGFVVALAEGKLDVTPPHHNLLVSPFKQLHANLLHLTWQTKQIAAGDYTQRVHFMGDFAEAFNAMIMALAEKKRVEDSLREALETVRQLQGIIPICMYCKKIRNDNDYWDKLENYLSDHTDIEFSHGICPDCFDARYGER